MIEVTLDEKTDTGQALEWPTNYPADWIEDITLKDGLQVHLRPILPSDAPRLQEGFKYLSPRSIYMRFFETYKSLPDEMAQSFSNLDYQERMAFIGEIDIDGQRRIIGVARFGMLGPERPGMAESAVVVADDFQRRGLGSMLVQRLVNYACLHGVQSMLATVHISNLAILNFIRSSGFLFSRKMLEPGVFEITIHLPSRESFQGSLLGLAVGDALGAPVEFMAPGSFPPVQGMLGGGTWGLKPGQWTDDTSLALCLAASLVESGGFDPADQMQRYTRWWKQGYMSSTGFCFDIGNTTRAALEQFARSGEPYSGPTDPSLAGNGSLMRLAPVPMFYARRADLVLRMCADSSRTTHGARQSVDACRYFGGLLLAAFYGVEKDVLLSPRYSPVLNAWEEEPLHEMVDTVAAGSFKLRQPPAIRGAGYVVDCLEAALWAFYNSDDFRSGVLLAVNLGDDADTTAAVYGQLAGAYYGVKGIPEEWLEQLYQRPLLDDYAGRLFSQVCTR